MKTCDNDNIGTHELGTCPNICDTCYDHLDSVGGLNFWEDPS